MRMKLRKIRFETIALMLLYIVYVFVLFWFHPFVASAAETDTANKNVPGGYGNTVRIYNVHGFVHTGNWAKEDRTIKMKKDIEMIGFIKTYKNSDGVVFEKDISFLFCKDGHSGSVNLPVSELMDDYVGVHMEYSKETLTSSWAYKDANICNSAYYYYGGSETRTVEACTITGMKIFADLESAQAYADNGSLDGLIKEDLDTSWYLKDIRCKVTADDSPSGSGGEDATYIKFFWMTDNLENGDLIEVKTRNYLKKFGGDKISGFHDYITFNDNISAVDNLFNFTDKNGVTSERASWTVGQKDAVKAWFALLENKPLIFKTYETEIYYFRPYRNGKVGKWCKVTMGRNPLTNGSPYIEKVEIGDIDDDGEFVRDDDLTDENGGDHGVDQGGDDIIHDPENPFEGTNIVGIFNYLFDFFKSLPSLLGDLPSLFNSILGFLSLPVIAFIAAGILIAIVLRIVGR